MKNYLTSIADFYTLEKAGVYIYKEGETLHGIFRIQVAGWTLGL